MLKTINTKKRTGFTLVEMLVAIAVFMVVMTVAVGSVVAIIDANRKAQAIKNVVNNINFALESISKDMRVGTNYFCHQESGEYGSLADCPGDGGNGVRYVSSKDFDNDGTRDLVHYRFFKTPSGEDGNIQRCTKNTCGDDDWESLTAPIYNVKITNMKFYVLGADTNNNLVVKDNWKQPRVIITLEGTAGTKDSVKTNFNIQTTVSQRSREAH